jgi:hypothetical protein
MNFLIDGAYGDLYREAMGHRRLLPARDVWETEQHKGNELQPEPKPKVKAQFLKRLAAWLRHRQSTPVFATTKTIGE